VARLARRSAACIQATNKTPSVPRWIRLAGIHIMRPLSCARVHGLPPIKMDGE